jgi:hypothetical protein
MHLNPSVRYLHRPLKENLLAAVGSSSASQQASYFDDCTAKDLPLAPRNTTLFPEYAPYGLAQIQAAANSSKLPNRTDDKGVMICIIDSGLDIGHPDLKVCSKATAAEWVVCVVATMPESCPATATFPASYSLNVGAAITAAAAWQQQQQQLQRQWRCSTGVAANAKIVQADAQLAAFCKEPAKACFNMASTTLSTCLQDTSIDGCKHEAALIYRPCNIKTCSALSVFLSYLRDNSIDGCKYEDEFAPAVLSVCIADLLKLQLQLQFPLAGQQRRWLQV